jgi:LmbE family N-acetylglucosaminyl deacetylase
MHSGSSSHLAQVEIKPEVVRPSHGSNGSSGGSVASVLIVVAHPDDEVLGCGGTAAQYAASGVPVQACVLCGLAEVRRNRPGTRELRAHMDSAAEILGMRPPIVGDFPNLALNTVPHRELTAFIESAIESSKATMIFTHHPADLNDDHLHVSRACQAAARIGHRREGFAPLCGLYFMEVLSSTDWAFRSAAPPFVPDTFVPLDDAAMQRKIDALEVYTGVTREFPHSRSHQAIRALSSMRGAQAHVKAAEGFQTAFSRLLAPVRVG